jgi:hypothetical protein
MSMPYPLLTMDTFKRNDDLTKHKTRQHFYFFGGRDGGWRTADLGWRNIGPLQVPAGVPQAKHYIV